jgi:hypothetical protein
LLALKKTLEEKGLSHLKAGKRGEKLTIFSDEGGIRFNRCRFNRFGNNKCLLFLSMDKSVWERTPHMATVQELVDILKKDYSWCIEE